MDKAEAAKPYTLDDRSTSDIIVRLKNIEGRPEFFYCHSSILIQKSKYFADRLSQFNSSSIEIQCSDSYYGHPVLSQLNSSCIEIQCSDSDYDHHIRLLRLLYLPEDSRLDSLNSVRTTLGILQVAVNLDCEEIIQSCIQYLEAAPWDDNEEEEIIKSVAKLGSSIAMPILARIQPVDFTATKNVFISAVRFATSMGGECPPFGDELKTSAQEQVEYMLGEDDDSALVAADDEVKSEIKKGLSNLCSLFEVELSSLLLDASDLTSETAGNKIMQALSDIEWICNILPKMDLMKEFVSIWVEISGKVLIVVEDKKLDSLMWGLKVKLIEVTSKVLEAVGYGNVILPSPSRVKLLKTWLPYVRKMKSLLDSKAKEDTNFPYKMDEDLCQSVEGGIVSLVLALPSNDQAEILTDWMNTEQMKFPDLSEAFEVWCYRTKSAKRRLVEGLGRVSNAAVTH